MVSKRGSKRFSGLPYRKPSRKKKRLLACGKRTLDYEKRQGRLPSCERLTGKAHHGRAAALRTSLADEIDMARISANSRLIDMTIPQPRKRNTGPKRLRSDRGRKPLLLPGNQEQVAKKSAKHW